MARYRSYKNKPIPLTLSDYVKLKKGKVRELNISGPPHLYNNLRIVVSAITNKDLGAWGAEHFFYDVNTKASFTRILNKLNKEFSHIPKTYDNNFNALYKHYNKVK